MINREKTALIGAIRGRVQATFTLAEGRHGYRRIHAVLTRNGGFISEKIKYI